MDQYFTLIKKIKSVARDYFALFNLLSKRRKTQIFCLFLLSILSAICETANIGILIPFLRILADTEGNIYKLGIIGVVFQSLPSELILPTLGICFILLILLTSFIRVLTIRYQLRLGSLICADLGKYAYMTILRRPYEWHVHTKTSSIITLLTHDVDRVVVMRSIFAWC